MSYPYKLPYHTTSPTLEWGQDSQPLNADYADTYYSKQDGLAESQYVFQELNDLPAAWQNKNTFTIAELGFGTGLNFLITADSWQRTAPQKAKLQYISFEMHPLTLDDMKKAHSQFTQISDTAALFYSEFQNVHAGVNLITLPRVGIDLILIIGDANEFLPQLNFKADAWFLDGFKPQSNPNLWSSNLLAEVKKHSHAQSTLSTFSAARVVKDALTNVGLQYRKVPGFGTKRDSLRIFGASGERVTPSLPDKVFIIGAGLAGCFMAWSLCRRGIRVEILESADSIAAKASGNPLGLAKPDFSVLPDARTELSIAGFALLKRIIARLDPSNTFSTFTGIYRSSQYGRLENFSKAFEALAIDPHWVRRTATGQCTYGTTNDSLDGFFYENAGSVNPKALCQSLLDDCGNLLDIRLNTLIDKEFLSQQIPADSYVVLANSFQAGALLSENLSRVTYNYGQIFTMQSNEPKKDVPLIGPGYVIPIDEKSFLLGSTYEHENSPSIQEQAKEHLFSKMEAFLQVKFSSDKYQVQSRRSIRCNSSNRLPILGSVPTGWHEFTHTIFILTALGSKGLTYAPLCAEVNAALICNEALPITRHLFSHLSVNRC